MLKNGDISRRRYEMIAGTLAEDLRKYEVTVTVLPLQSVLVAEALTLLPEHPLRAGDALHVATALRLRRSLLAEPLYMVVADKRIREACAAIGLLLVDPEASDAGQTLHKLRGGE